MGLRDGSTSCSAETHTTVICPWAGRPWVEAMSGGSRGVGRGSFAVCEVKSEACSGRVDGLIKALGPRLWPQRSATLADGPCYLARAAA